MKKTGTSRGKENGAVELIEEATFLLRRAPAETLALYYIGTLPFVLAALYFWADMSRGADAGGHLAGASLGLALLFIWMKFWQSRFCAELSRLLLNGPATPTAVDIALTQTVVQPWSLVFMPLALLITLPFGWCLAFFQNVTVMGGGPDLRSFRGTARRQALLWPGQNHVLIFIFALLGMIVFANLCVGVFFLPRLLKSLLGVESLFTRGNYFLLNSTFWAAMAVLTHICIDPLVKAAYLLRCHYGESIATGADLLAELKEVKRKAGAGLAVLILAGSLLLAESRPVMAGGAVDGQVAAHTVVDPRKLDRAIEKVISGPEFAWRLPRVQQKKELPGFLRSAVELISDWADSAGRWIKRFLQWLADHMPRFKPGEERTSGGFGFRDYVFPLMYGLLALCLSAGVVCIWRQARHWRGKGGAVEHPPSVVEMDVGDENVLADELPEERWSALAKELLAKGELRLGMRALYLACLAFLAEEGLIAIARYKSNRDYERELGRFGHALPEVVDSFSRNVVLFERAWYGKHMLEQGTVESFTANYERIVSGVRQG